MWPRLRAAWDPAPRSLSAHPPPRGIENLRGRGFHPLRGKRQNLPRTGSGVPASPPEIGEGSPGQPTHPKCTQATRGSPPRPTPPNLPLPSNSHFSPFSLSPSSLNTWPSKLNTFGRKMNTWPPKLNTFTQKLNTSPQPTEHIPRHAQPQPQTLRASSAAVRGEPVRSPRRTESNHIPASADGTQQQPTRAAQPRPPLATLPSQRLPTAPSNAHSSTL